MDEDGKELTSPELWALFRQAYLLDDAPMTLIRQQTVPTSPDSRELVATLRKADGDDASPLTARATVRSTLSSMRSKKRSGSTSPSSTITSMRSDEGRTPPPRSYVEIHDAADRRCTASGWTRTS